MNLEEITKQARERGMSDGEIRQIYAAEGISEDQINQYVPFDYDTFYQNARQQKKTNNQMREMMFQEGLSKDYVNSKMPLDIAELRDRAVERGMSDSEVKQILADEGYSNRQIENMYSYGKQAYNLMKKGYTQEDVKNYAVDMIKMANMSQQRAWSFLNTFFGLGAEDAAAIRKEIYGDAPNIDELKAMYESQGMRKSDASQKAYDDYSDWENRRANPSVIDSFIPQNFLDAAGRFLQPAHKLGKMMTGQEITPENQLWYDYYQWLSEKNPVIKATSYAPLIASSFYNPTLPATIGATYFSGVYGSLMEGNSLKDAAVDGLKDLAFLGGLYTAFKAAPYVWQGVKHPIDTTTSLVKGATYPIRHPINSGKWIADKIGDATTYITKPYVMKDIINTYGGNKELIKQTLNEIKKLDLETALPAHLGAFPDENFLVKRITDLASRDLIGSSLLTKQAKEAEKAMLRDFDAEKEALFGKSRWAEFVDGKVKFQGEIQDYLATSGKIRKDEANALYDQVRKRGDKIPLNKTDAKKLQALIDDIDNYVVTNQSQQGENFLGSVEKNLLYRYQMGDSLIIGALKDFNTSRYNRRLNVLDTKNIQNFENFATKAFKDSFTKEELHKSATEVKKYIASLKAQNANVNKEIAIIEDKLRQKEQLTRPNKRTKEIVANLLEQKRGLSSKIISEEELNYIKNEWKAIAQYLKETERLKKTPTVSDLVTSIQRYNEMNPNLDFVRGLATKGKNGLKDILASKTVEGNAEYNKTYGLLQEANEKWRTYSSLYKDSNESPGLYQLVNSSTDFAQTLSNVLSSQNYGVATTKKLVDELNIAFKDNPTQLNKVKTQLAGYIIDSKIAHQINQLPEKGQVKNELQDILTGLEQVPTTALQELGADSAIELVNTYKKAIQRVIEINKTVAPTRFNITQADLNVFNILPTIFTKVAFSKVLREPKVTKEIVNELNKLIDSNFTDTKTINKIIKMVDTEESAMWKSVVARDIILADRMNQEESPNQ